MQKGGTYLNNYPQMLSILSLELEPLWFSLRKLSWREDKALAALGVLTKSSRKSCQSGIALEVRASAIKDT